MSSTPAAEEHGSIRRRARTGRRAAHIASVLARNGLGFIGDLAGLHLPGRSDQERSEAADLGARAAAAAGVLGPTFVLLAHLAAARVDLLGLARCAELATATVAEDADDPVGPDEAVAGQLGVDAAAVFAWLDPAPASRTPVDLVHRATLRDGSDALIVVRRPGVTALIEEDLAVLAPAARLLSRRADTGDVDFEAELAWAAEQIRRDVDLGEAAHVLDRLAGPGVPTVVWEHTHGGLLTTLPAKPARAADVVSALVEGVLCDWTVPVHAGDAIVDAGDGAFVLSPALRWASIDPGTPHAFGAIAAAVLAGDVAGTAAALASAATRGSGGPVATLETEVREVLRPEGTIGDRVAAVLAAGGRQGLRFTRDLDLVAAFAMDAGRVADVEAVLRSTLVPAAGQVAVAPATPPVHRPIERGPRVIGLALSGGAIRGAAHGGAISVLYEGGIRFDCIAGTSAGAIVGALLAAGTMPDEINRIIGAMRWSTVARPVPSRLGMLNTAPLERFLEETLGPLRFEDLLCPLAVVACDLATGEKVVISDGPVAPAVRASAALPGVFPPVELGGRLLVDGGIVDNVPADVAYEQGADYVIAVDVSAPLSDQRPTSFIDVMLMTSTILTRRQIGDRRTADATIRVDLASFSGRSVADVPAINERGRAAATAALPQILEDLG